MSSSEESLKACGSSAFLSLNPSRNVIKRNSVCASELMRHRVLHTLKIAGSILNFQYNVLPGNNAGGDGGRCGGDQSLLGSVHM